MTTQHDTLTIRPIAGRHELDLFCRLPYTLNDEIHDDVDAGRRRREWMWVALRGDRLIARASWWGQPASDVPQLFDVFDLDIDELDVVDVGVQLLDVSMHKVVPARPATPEYIRFVPSDWRDDAAIRRGVQTRMAALERVGARLLVERLRFEWRPGTPVAPPSGRLAFRPVRDRDEILALMTRVLDGTLDAYSRADLARMPAEQAALAHYEEELEKYVSPPDWWRIATLPDGEPVGFVTPAHNHYNPIIGYLGVLPEHRGNGYIDDILTEGTRFLADRGEPRIRAATDLGNVPMARAFERAGYVNFERSINMTWSEPDPAAS